MDLEIIVQELNQRFAVSLPEFYQRRIIFWYDEDREFEENIGEMQLDDATVISLTSTNNFQVKKLLSVDDLNSNYLVYCPVSYEKPEDNWLLDIERYSEAFRADMISIWMDELGIPSTPAMRKQVKEYRKFFNAKLRRDKVIAQGKDLTVPNHIHLAVMGAIANVSDVTWVAIIKTVLSNGLNLDTNEVYQGFVTYGVEEAFWKMVQQGTGYQVEEPELGQLIAHIVMTAATRTIRLEYLAGLEGFISAPHQAYCYDLLSDWLHSEESNKLNELVRIVEDELNIPKRFMKLRVEDLMDTEIFPCIHEVILVKMMTEIADNIVDVDTIITTVEQRRTCVWYEEVKDFYEGILQVAHMQKFFMDHSTGFHCAEAVKVWKEYTTDYYKMDTYYRLFQKSYGDSLKAYNSNLHDLFSLVCERVEGLYENWFLGQLGSNWYSVSADELKEYGRILEVSQQTDFYKSKVQKLDTKIFVIISDALRYEVAAALTEQLRRETQSKVDLNNMQGIFPTITKFGMAALLPHKDLTVEAHGDVLKVLADGQYTDSGYRDKVLKQENTNSVAVMYSDLVSAKRAERSAMVKGMDVVYIYHDTIDDASHTSDSMVFPACEDAIVELKNLVKIIVSDFGGTNIYITADHGFLYTYSPLNEDDKIAKSDFGNYLIEYGRRYAIMKKDFTPEHLLPVKFLEGSSMFDGFAPRENIRIKMNGGGLNFVHGGTSLQEMCVPLIEYHYIRSNTLEYKRNKHKYDTKPVEVNLLSATHKIGNMYISLNFYQKEAVGDNREAATYQVYFTDSNGKQISDIQKIIADKTSDNEQERKFRCGFNLKSQKYDNKEIYYLVIADENGLITSREEFQIDIPFAVEDYGFLS